MRKEDECFNQFFNRKVIYQREVNYLNIFDNFKNKIWNKID